MVIASCTSNESRPGSSYLQNLNPNTPAWWLCQVCVQLGDPVPFRFHWPRAADLRANNMQYRPYGRNPNNKLGNNARDEPANIGEFTLENACC